MSDSLIQRRSETICFNQGISEKCDWMGQQLMRPGKHVWDQACQIGIRCEYHPAMTLGSVILCALRTIYVIAFCWTAIPALIGKLITLGASCDRVSHFRRQFQPQQRRPLPHAGLKTRLSLIKSE